MITTIQRVIAPILFFESIYVFDPVVPFKKSGTLKVDKGIS